MFLDDDDELESNFLQAFSKATTGTDADLVIFRAKFPDGRLLPRVPIVEWGNVHIGFAVKTDVIRKHPFIKGENAFRANEDFEVLKRIEEAGYKIHFSPAVVYLVKPDPENQKNARINKLP